MLKYFKISSFVFSLEWFFGIFFKSSFIIIIFLFVNIKLIWTHT